MRTEHLLAEMRGQLRALLPERAFLRRDRGEALFISNAPAFAPDITDIPGFIAKKEGMLLHLLPDEGWISRLEEACGEAPDHFCKTLMRFRGTAPDRANLQLFARGVKLLEGRPTDAEISAFDRAVRQAAAVALRDGCGGGLYACAILNCEIHTLYKGEKHT